ncbi:hypothetical protein [Streptomyces sp. SAI-208]|uniref:hypothetical protein n=1 Tax=Streptomyces sp. SAI-208 TaxID=2940550 RepID=UPI002473FA47|nr:hypothetical protein [Streptomyces sp. SAI-208]
MTLSDNLVLKPLDYLPATPAEFAKASAVELFRLLEARNFLIGSQFLLRRSTKEKVARDVAAALVLPQSERWREAQQTALLGAWSDALWDQGHLTPTALSAVRAEARALHRQLVPVWRRRNRHGRVLSLDADLGGFSLYDLVASHVDELDHTDGGVFEDERLNALLRALAPGRTPDRLRLRRRRRHHLDRSRHPGRRPRPRSLRRTRAPQDQTPRRRTAPPCDAPPAVTRWSFRDFLPVRLPLGTEQ